MARGVKDVETTVGTLDTRGPMPAETQHPEPVTGPSVNLTSDVRVKTVVKLESKKSVSALSVPLDLGGRFFYKRNVFIIRHQRVLVPRVSPSCGPIVYVCVILKQVTVVSS